MQLPSNSSHSGPAEVYLASTICAIGCGKMVEMLVAAEPVLESLSYLIAVIAGLVTIYYKIKKKG